MDISEIQDFFEDQMDGSDTISATRDIERTSDDTWDPNTGEYTPDTPDTILTDAPAILIPIAIPPNEEPEGGQPKITTFFKLHVKIAEDLLIEYDAVTVTASTRDPSLVGQEFIVVDTFMDKSYPVSREYRVRQKNPIPY